MKNLSFILSFAKVYKLNMLKLFKTVNHFKGLNFRQQIIYKNKFVTIINDSKSTSFSSSVNLLKSYKNIFWHVFLTTLKLMIIYFKNELYLRLWVQNDQKQAQTKTT